MKNKITLLILLFATLGQMASVSSSAQGTHDTGGGKIKEQDLKGLMLDLIPYFQSKEGRKAFKEVDDYDRSHPEETIEDLLLKTAPKLVIGELRDQFDADRDCISYYGDPSNRYFECNQNALPEYTLDNQPRLSRFVLHEIFVQAGIERRPNIDVPSIYNISGRLEFHKETFERWMPGKESGDHSRIVHVSCGADTCCAIDKNFRTKCWGNNRDDSNYQGEDDYHYGNRPNSMGSYLPFLPFASIKVNSSSPGIYHEYFTTPDGKLFKYTPIHDALPEKVNFKELYHSDGGTLFVKQVTAGHMADCALIAHTITGENPVGREVRCWGYGYQIDTAMNFGIREKDEILQITGNKNSFCALFGNGSVKCWGDRYNNQITPFLHFGTREKVTQIFAAEYHSCAIFESGRIKCWGLNSHGQLGLGDRRNRQWNTSDMDSLPFIDLGITEKVKSLSLGMQHTCALTESGRVKCWGANEHTSGVQGIGGGQLGLEDEITRGVVPEQMGKNLPFVNFGKGLIATEITSAEGSTCVLIQGKNKVKCWGVNTWGTVGTESEHGRGSHKGEMGNFPYLKLNMN